MKSNQKVVRKAVLPALAVLMASVMALTTATYAWFTMGTTAQATGFELSTTAANGLLISAYPTAAVGNNQWHTVLTAADVETGNGITFPSSDEFINVSSATGTGNFYAGTGEYPYTTFTTDGVTANEDYVEFRLAVVYTSDTPVYVDAARTTVTVPTDALNGTAQQQIAKALRISVTPTGGSTVILEPNAAVGTGYTVDPTLKSTKVDAITAAEGTTTPQSTTVIGDTNIACGSLTANESKVYTVRIWLEGQDAECVNAITGGNFVVNIALTVDAGA